MSGESAPLPYPPVTPCLTVSDAAVAMPDYAGD